MKINLEEKTIVDLIQILGELPAKATANIYSRLLKETEPQVTDECEFLKVQKPKQEVLEAEAIEQPAESSPETNE